MHGSNLVKAMKNLDADVHFLGIGGKRMESRGVDILTPASEMAVVGLAEVIPKLYSIARISFRLKSIMKSNRPDLLILIDYPDFNINLARRAKQLNIPVLYYISPQIWAWRSGRVKKIAYRVDKMVVILPFEKDFYLESGLDTAYVGHPLLDADPSDSAGDRRNLIRDPGLGDSGLILGLVPGSRKEEINHHLVPMIKTAEILSSHYRNIRCVLPLAPTIPRAFVQEITKRSYLEIKVVSAEGDTPGIIGACDLALVASGTATLETAIMEVPMIIVYRVAPVSYWIGKRVVDVPYISLVNLVAEEEIVPELIQDEVTPQRLVEESLAILEDPFRRETMINGLRSVKERLGKGGASERTAKIAMEMMKKEKP